MSIDQEMALLRDQIAKICAAGCPETYRLPERGWLLVHEALRKVTDCEASSGQGEQEVRRTH
jgi:hypothetical protein